jgi:MFS transporter, YQGE family, putative transporter
VTVTKAPLKGQAWWLLVISGVFALSVALSNTFVNVYLWKVDKSYIAIGWYNLAVYGTMPLAFIVAGWIVHRMSGVWTLRIGILLHAGFYLVALTGGTTVARLPWMLGVVMGLAGGFYWFSFNLLCLRYTQAGSREKFYGLNGVMGAIAGMVAPPVSGFLISFEDRLGGLSGYHVIFSLSLGLFVLATGLSFRLHANRLDGKLRLHSGLTALRNRSWRMLMIGCTIYGLREGVFLFLIGLLMYLATSSEMKLGEFMLLQSALSFVSFYLVSRWIKPTNRLKAMGTGAVLMGGAALLFLLPMEARHILWYGSIIALSIPLFLVPLQGYVFDGISQLSEANLGDTEHVIVREVFENAGRVIGICAFLLLVGVAPNPRFIAYFAFGLGYVQLATFGFIMVGQKGDMKAKKGANAKMTTGNDVPDPSKCDSHALARRKAGT